MELPVPFNRTERANQIFCEALDRENSRRPHFVRQRCAEDPELCDSILHLLSRYEQLGNFLETPAFAAPELINPICAGELLGDRFRILNLLGSGGMGDVFRAHDTELDETVALKAIRPRLRGEVSIATRFRNEIRLARRISHPNVCRIFDLFVERRGADEILFFTMEFLNGPTLAHRLAAPIDTALAMAFARQIASALAAAHSIGIVHRDLKPANILLVSEPNGGERAVITDFGLAKAFEGGDELPGSTIAGQIMGTPEYMAPEQFLSGEVGPATDVFAFGLILFEMLAGRVPFPKEDVVRCALRRMTASPEPLSRYLPHAPAHWSDAIARALAATPDKRFQTPGEVLAALEGPPRAPAFIPRLSRRAVLYSALASLPLAGFWGYSRFKQQAGQIPPKPLIMLTPITSSSSPPAAQVLDLLIGNQLQQSARVQILSGDRIQSAWQRVAASDKPAPRSLEPAVARHVAMREGAHLVFFGDLSKVGDESTLQVHLELMGGDPARGRKIWPKAIPVPRETDLASAAQECANWVRRTAGETAAEMDAHGRRPEELTTPSWQALREYVDADTAWNDGHSGAALLHVKTAADLDPNFALALARRADFLTALHRPDEGLPLYGAAAEAIRAKNLTDRESLRIRGLFAADTGRFAESEQVFNRYALEYPDDGLPLFYKATAADHAGRPEEALHLAESAIATNPKSYSFLMLRVRLLLDAGRLGEAEAQFQTPAALKPGDWTDQMRSALAFGKLEMAAAWRSLEHMRTAGSLPYQSRAFGFQACFRAEQGNAAAAEQLLRDGLAFDIKMGTGEQPQFSKLRSLVQLFLLYGREREAIGVCRAMLRLSLGHEQRMAVGCLLAQAGDRAGAKACIVEDLPDWPIYRHWSMRLKGELALASALPDKALQWMQNAPPGRLKGEWPRYLVRAALAAGKPHVVRAHVAALVRSPGRFWAQADTTGPGFVNWAVQLPENVNLPEPERKGAQVLNSVLHKQG